MAATLLTTLTTHHNIKPTIKHPPETNSLKLHKTLKELKQHQAHITKQGLNKKTHSLTQLIASCAELATPESLNHARKAFKLYYNKKENAPYLYLLNCLIRGYAFCGFCDESIKIFVEMSKKNVKFDHYTFPFVLSACAKKDGFFEGIQVHGCVVKMGFENDVYIRNSLIHFYCESGEVEKGRKVFDEMSQRNVVSWTSLICGFARWGCAEEAVSLFFEMVENGVRANEVTLVCVISACGKLRDLEMGERVWRCIGELGVEENAVLVNAVVDMYMKCGDADKAREVFRGCVGGDLGLYNTILSNYVHQGLAREVVPVLNDMLRQGLKPDRITMLSVISAAVELENYLYGKECHGYVLRNGFEGCDSISNSLINMYMKCGKKVAGCMIFDRMVNKTVVSYNSLIAGLIRNDDVELARKIFIEMPETNLVSWNTILAALVQESLFEEAIEHFRVMQSKGIKSDEVTMVSVVSACGYLGALALAKWTYKYIETNNIFCDLRLNTALVDMFARCGDTQSAMLVFDTMKERDVSAWTAAIGAMAVEGNGERAVQLFHEMIMQGVKPDEVAFTRVLTACSHGGLVDRGLSIFQSMTENYKISPQIVHYGCVVDLLGRAGLLSKALDLIKTMPMAPNDIVWSAFLAACRTHKNEKLATYAAGMIAKSTGENTGVHVLLSNIYASAGKWTDVAEVRLNMKATGIKKVPGSSSIEANGVIHEFTSGDQSHLVTDLVLPMLEEINYRLRDVAHVPDLKSVLLDVDEQEKDILLGRHSEKLALAFGLISTSHGTPIRIIKNLRMCSDCHSYAKLVSKMYNRKIIIRDNNRFHFFQHGICSCNDYW
ncbi:Pentatricopeptide repeat-containing protein [Heracleum sosnowskyi]|uniref:Pentatricopeptide repeat-containing protein n=1 Tax=Heracleum sosnowskyi TaxID=360622 RepID=A0AAD8IPT2_9APIA|nr:Pentatricopeptide repeat-containing protein [Heracleum sosnowskyi]